jgi:hypothetical protein
MGTISTFARFAGKVLVPGKKTDSSDSVYTHKRTPNRRISCLGSYAFGSSLSAAPV